MEKDEYILEVADGIGVVAHIVVLLDANDAGELVDVPESALDCTSSDAIINELNRIDGLTALAR